MAVLAHPSTVTVSRQGLRALIQKLTGLGLQGIEVYYSEHNVEQVAQYRELAREFALVPTGGSDFHGTPNPQIRLGIGFGQLVVPDEVESQLRARCAA